MDWIRKVIKVVRKKTDKKSSENDLRLRLLGGSGDKEKEMRRKIDRRLKKSDWYDFLKKRINVINKSYRLEVNRVYRSMGNVLHKTLQKSLPLKLKTDRIERCHCFWWGTGLWKALVASLSSAASLGYTMAVWQTTASLLAPCLGLLSHCAH